MSEKLERFNKYLTLYQKLVMKNAEKYVAHRYVEDVVQETYLRMYEHLDALEDARIKNWLIVISGNIAKDYAKKGGSISEEPIDPLILRRTMQKRTQSAEASYEESERQKAVFRILMTALDILYEKNPNWYYVMIDSCFFDMSSVQIAKALKTTPGNVDVMKLRARKYLHKKLGEEIDHIF